MNKPFSFQNCSGNLPQGDESVNPQPSKDGRRHLLKAGGQVGGLTLISRILGMIRDVVCARSFGTTWQWDGFIYAFMLPNFFRRLVGEGALSSAFVPVYTKTLQDQGQIEATHFAHVIFSFLTVVFLAVILLLELVLFLVLQYVTLPERFLLVLDLLRILFPYLACMSFYAVCMGILNSHKHFWAPALGPIILNVAWIAGVLWLSGQDMLSMVEQLRGLSWVILLAGAIQVAVQVPHLYATGFRFRWVFNLKHEGFKRLVQLIGPVTLGFAVMQINLLVDMTLSFFIGSGANSSLWYGNRLMQLPLGVFAIAMGTVLLPTIARQMAEGKKNKAAKSLSFALRLIFLLVLPCMVGFIVLASPIVQMLFERGAFDEESTRRTAMVLICYSVGLVAYSAQKILTSGFHAAQNTTRPVKIAGIALVSNIVFNLILMGPLKEAGLALATSISGILQFFLLFFYLRKDVVVLPGRELVQSFLKIGLASLLMGVTAMFMYNLSANYFNQDTFTGQTTAVLLTILGAALSYFVFCLICRVSEVRAGFELYKAKFSKK